MVNNVLNKVNVMAVFISWRILLFLPLITGTYFVSVNNFSPVSFIYHYIESDLSFNSTFLNPWANFDGIHYLNIARDGYTNQARFFPLFPILIKLLSTSLAGSIFLVTIIFFLAIFFFHKLLTLDFSDQISKRILIYLLVFPTSFFFVSIYSEGLFLLLTVLSFYFARKRMWFVSLIFGMLLMVTRFVGIAILPALLYEFLTAGKIRVKKLLLFLITPLGLVLYGIFNNYKWHNFLYFIQAQGELGNNRTVESIVFFPQTIYRYFKILTTVPVSSYDWIIAFLEIGSFLFAAALLYLAWTKKIRPSYLIFALVNFAVAISTGTFTGLPRYTLTIFPIFIALALVESKALKLAYLVFSPVLLFILLMLFSRGYFVA